MMIFFTFQANSDDTFRFVTEGILLTTVSVFGLVGNCMSIIVLTRASNVVRQGGASFSKLLRGLASFDALFLVIALISFGFPQLSQWFSKNIFLYIMPVVFGLLHTFRVGSVYVTLAVTFERFHAIICPLKHFAWKKYLLPASVFIAVVYNIPKYFEMEMKVWSEFFLNNKGNNCVPIALRCLFYNLGRVGLRPMFIWLVSKDHRFGSR